VSYLKKEIFRLDNILKNAIFDDLKKKKKKLAKSSSNGTIIIMMAFGKYMIRNS